MMHMDEHGHHPMVSVIMPAYNAEMYIEEAISSVMEQTLTDWELLVIDDCSTDHTYDKALSMSIFDERVRIIRNEKNLGVSRTRNHGLDIARGQYIAFIDSDDLWHQEKLQRQIKKMNDLNAEICYSSYEIVDAAGKNSRADLIVPCQVDLKQLLKANVILCSSLLISADVLRNVRFSTEFYHEDYALELQLLKEGATAVGCTEPLVKWRFIENSRSFNNLSLFACMYYFVHYTCAGVHKYFRRY